MGVHKMDREKAQKLAEAFKDDWKIDPKARRGLHKKTGFEIFMGGTYYDDEGHAHYECMFRATQEHPEEELTDEVIRRLQREAAILKEAGYMPGRTKYEQEQENLRIDREAAKVREELHQEALRQEKYWEEHPQEYEEFVANNRRMYEEKKRNEELKWYKDRGFTPPKELTNER